VRYCWERAELMELLHSIQFLGEDPIIIRPSDLLVTLLPGTSRRVPARRFRSQGAGPRRGLPGDRSGLFSWPVAADGSEISREMAEWALAADTEPNDGRCGTTFCAVSETGNWLLPSRERAQGAQGTWLAHFLSRTAGSGL